MWNSCTQRLLVLVGVLSGCTRAELSAVRDSGVLDDAAAETPASRDGSQGDLLVCRSPTPDGCLPPPQTAGVCDPVCQVGACDWCSQKCSYAADGSPVCSRAGEGKAYGPCIISLAGTAQQSDDCTPGNICLVPELGSGLSYCFALCRSSLDCPGGVTCSDRTLSNSSGRVVLVKVCDPPYRSCSPASPQPCCDPIGSTLADCAVGQFCYLVSSDPGTQDNRTVCDFATGGGGPGAPCSASRDCLQGWTCVGAQPGGAGVCRQVCNRNAANPCGSSSRTCLDFGNQYGICSD
jgi:hypothetical protein